MKRPFLLLLLFLTVISVSAQKRNIKKIPAGVLSAFELVYPQAGSVKWTVEDDKYEAGFRENETVTSVLFDASGKLLETEQEIAITELPGSVLLYVSNLYPGKKITEAAKIKNAEGVVKYEAEVAHKDLMFDEEGKFIEEIWKQK